MEVGGGGESSEPPEPTLDPPLNMAESLLNGGCNWVSRLKLACSITETIVKHRAS